ncbi:MAG: hypothetical protein FJX76_18710 [Armatimonadetes bacterium]|nr:hypothetical protein [Armatimonadota bacterium]
MPSKSRRVAFWLLTLTLLYGCLEFFSLFAFHLLDGGFSFAGLAGDRARSAGEIPGQPGATPLALYALHPFVGYTDQASPVVRRTPAEMAEFTSSPQVAVVGIFGGSVAQELSASAVLVQALQASPRFAGRQIRMLVGATGGYKQPQHVAALAYLLSLGARFDVVINLDGFNELSDLTSPHGMSPVFPASWFRMQHDFSDPRQALALGELAVTARRRQQWAALCARPPLGWSVTASLLWRVGDRYLANLAAEQQLALDALGKPTQPLPALPVDDAALQATLVSVAEVWRRGSEQMAALCAASGAQYVHCLQPTRYLNKRLTEEERRAAPNGPGRVVAAGYPELRQRGLAMRAAGLPFHDLTGMFSEEPRAIYRDECHCNQIGQDALARAVARAVLEP